jgi:hypothetical protein
VGCACLTMNDVGEPCAGEPHARFDRGPLATRNKPCGGRWSRAGALKHATTTAWSGPQPQPRSADPAAYLTIAGASSWVSSRGTSMMPSTDRTRAFEDAELGIASRSTQGARTGTSSTRLTLRTRAFSDARFRALAPIARSALDRHFPDT